MGAQASGRAGRSTAAVAGRRPLPQHQRAALLPVSHHFAAVSMWSAAAADTPAAAGPTGSEHLPTEAALCRQPCCGLTTNQDQHTPCTPGFTVAGFAGGWRQPTGITSCVSECRRLGVNHLRMFSNTVASYRKVQNDTWGYSLSGARVNTEAAWRAAVGQLRSPAGWGPMLGLA
jgi:hypothetical protein